MSEKLPHDHGAKMKCSGCHHKDALRNPQNPRSRFLVRKLIILQPVNKCAEFNGFRRFVTRYFMFLSKWIQSKNSNSFLDMVFICMQRSLYIFYQNLVYISLLFHINYASTQPIFIDLVFNNLLSTVSYHPHAVSFCCFVLVSFPILNVKSSVFRPTYFDWRVGHVAVPSQCHEMNTLTF